MRFNSILNMGLLVLLSTACASSSKTTPASTASQTPAASTSAAQTTATSPAASPAPAKAEAKQSGLMCKRGSEERNIEIEAVEPKGCKLWYSRSNQKSVVASSEKAHTHCESVRDRIRGKLEAAQFKCSAAQQSSKAAEIVKAQPAASPSASVPSSAKDVKSQPAAAKEAKAQPAPVHPSKEVKPEPTKDQSASKQAEKKT